MQSKDDRVFMEHMMEEKMDFTKFINATKKYQVLGLCMIQNGKEILKYLPEGEVYRNIYSGTKSVTSAAVGFAVQEGVLSLDEYVIDCFPEEAPEEISDNLRQMQLIHLLTMSTGFGSPILMGDRKQLSENPNWVRHVLSQPVIHRPGTSFLYTNAGPYLLGVLIQRRSGMGLIEYLMPRLFEPLDIEPGSYEKCRC